VLLIIFMVITPMLQKGKQVNMPKAQPHEDKENGDDPIYVSITPDKKVWVDQDELGDEAFVAEIEKKLIAKPGRKILLKGDETLVFDDVRKVMNLARKGGAKAIALGVEEEKK
jgi:biopolymer transport protein ExbD